VEKLRIAFFGTPEFAIPTLKKLIYKSNVEVVGVACQPDRPSGRGLKLHTPPIKELALAHGVPLLQPESLSKSPEAMETLHQWQPQMIVMVAFGQILKKAVLALPPQGIVNLHGSLLPAYRGPAPINWAIINGDTESGATTMFTEAGVDTGPMLLQARVPIGVDTTAIEFAKELSEVGADLVIETLDKLLAGSLKAVRQDDARATYAPMLNKELGHIDWQKTAPTLHNLVRGLVPWPGTYTTFRSAPLKVFSTSLNVPEAVWSLAKQSVDEPGVILEAAEKVYVKCGADGKELIQVLYVQPPNRSKMSASDLLHGARITENDRMGI
jgi:methionyl-tRNA formyltransferase